MSTSVADPACTRNLRQKQQTQRRKSWCDSYCTFDRSTASHPSRGIHLTLRPPRQSMRFVACDTESRHAFAANHSRIKLYINRQQTILEDESLVAPFPKSFLAFRGRSRGR